MADLLKVNIISPERRLLQGGRAQWITVQGSEGQVQVLPGHAAFLGSLQTGPFTYMTETGQQESGVISTGFFEVKNDEVTVLAETIELKGEIDLGRARAAQQKAEQALVAADLDEHKFRKYQLKLERALIRQQVSGSSSSH